MSPPRASDHPAAKSIAIVDSTGSRPNLCTIYSIANEDWLVTTWISAHEGSYYRLEDTR